MKSLLFDSISVNPLTSRGCSFLPAALAHRRRRYAATSGRRL